MSEEPNRGAVLIAACVVAAIRLRGESIQSSPRLKVTIYESVQLVLQVWQEIRIQGPGLLK